MSERPNRLTLLKGGVVLNDAKFSRRDILLRDNLVDSIVEPGEADHGSAEIVDAQNCAILPPFFNGHVHSPSTLLRGTENSYPLELWSLWAINYGRGATVASVRAAVRLTAIEMIRAGIGGYVDHFPPMRFAAEALAIHRESGLRIGFAPFFADLRDEDLLAMPLDRSVLSNLGQAAPADIGMLREFISGFAKTGSDRITPLLGPNAPQRCSQQLLEFWAEMAEHHGLGSHTHLLETYPQSRAANARWPGGAVPELERLGLLNERASFAHAIWLDDLDRERLARRGATVIHNPISNQMLGSGKMPVRAMLDAGVRVGLGTDCANTSGRHDLFETMRQMLVSGRVAGSWHGDWIRPEEVLRSAVEDGWAALGAGPARLCEGGAADLMILDFQSVTLAGAQISASSIVSHGDPRAVRSLMVDGQWLMRDREITVFNEAEIIAEATQLAAELRSLASDYGDQLKSVIADYDIWSRNIFTDMKCPHCSAVHI